VLGPGGRKLKVVLSGFPLVLGGDVWGIDYDHNVYRREGIVQYNPTGTKWTKVEGKLKQLDVFAGMVWGVDKDDKIWYREVGDSTPTTTSTTTTTTSTTEKIVVKTTTQSSRSPCSEGNTLIHIRLITSINCIPKL
jgi:hypothetical protein